MGPSRMEDEEENTITRSTCSKLYEDIGSFASGYRFKPEDDEIIRYYLIPKLNREELPPNFMHEIDLYESNRPDLNPDHLTKKYKAQDEGKWYLFTPRHSRHDNGSRPNRSSGTGHWKATGAEKPIHCSSNGQLLGYKTSLVFYQASPNSSTPYKTNWLMTEFKVASHITTKTAINPNKTADYDTSSGPPSKKRKLLDEWVLCKIYENEKRKSKTKNEGDLIKSEGEEDRNASCESENATTTVGEDTIEVMNNGDNNNSNAIIVAEEEEVVKKLDDCRGSTSYYIDDQKNNNGYNNVFKNEDDNGSNGTSSNGNAITVVQEQDNYYCNCLSHNDNNNGYMHGDGKIGEGPQQGEDLMVSADSDHLWLDEFLIDD